MKLSVSLPCSQKPVTGLPTEAVTFYPHAPILCDIWGYDSGMKITILWHVTTCRLVHQHQRIRKIWCFHLTDSHISLRTLYNLSNWQCRYIKILKYFSMTHFNIIFHLCIDLLSRELLWEFQTKILLEFLNSQCVQHVPPISISLTLSLHHHNKNNTNYEAPHCVIFSTVLLFNLSEVNMLASRPCSQRVSIFKTISIIRFIIIMHLMELVQLQRA